MRRRMTVVLVAVAVLLFACTQQVPQPTATTPPEPPQPQPTNTPQPEPTQPQQAEEPTATPPPAQAGPGAIERVCLITDVGRINDGTFNQFAYEGMIRAAEEFGLESDFIETQSQTDYQKNIQTCLDEGFDVLVTVGFLIADATLEAAQNNPDVYFIGVDQFFEAPPDNLVGIQYREDQGGFLAGALAAMMSESGVVAGIYGIDIPPVVKFRNGFEQGARYVNPDVTALGVYIPSFTDPAAGASAAEQFVGEGADVIFGAGGPTGSGGIKRAAELGAWVIGVDQDEYYTTFGGGTTPGADRLISSAVKRVDLGVYDQIKGLVQPETGLWAGGGLYILDAANGGITYAPFHEAEDDVPRWAQLYLERVRQGLADGSLDTGVDPVSGELLRPIDTAGLPKPQAPEGFKVCLITDVGRINDGTFNQFAYEGMVKAAEDLGFETDFIETQSQTDYQKNIQTCLDEGFDVLVTVGFLIADATLEAAQNNPDVYFIGVDQFFEAPPDNLVGIQYREDQGGFLAGALAGMMTESGVVAGIYGIDIPPVVKFRNGFEIGARYVNPDINVLGVYIPSFTDPAAGASAAEQFVGEGADVIFGAGGPTGSGGIKRAAELGAWVIGVDQDEYYTTFGGGTTPGADRLISSAVKRVDLGVYDQILGVIDGTFAGGGLYILDAANGGITYAPFHEAEDDVPEAVQARLEEIRLMLAAGELQTGVDPVTGDIIEDQVPEPVPFSGE
ncbi:MAG: BMP family ABC transporter substrate-binding protein [Ardenticatenia bacterium]|nr:BMP family ABC transporter substrate-binding protein [Ardenticatenia bacterium]